MGEGKWTHQTADGIAEILREKLKISISGTVVRRLLRKLGYSLKSNKKRLSSGDAPGRNEQFGNIADLRKKFTNTGNPIISVDTKKKEIIGLFKNAGRKWCKEAQSVKDHDFRSEASGLAVPYGIYDVNRNCGFLVVGESADTPEFAVNCIVQWWQNHGCQDYDAATELLILADCGGSNAARSRVWKAKLQEEFVNRFGLTVTVAHLPTGASKWNPIEHRMFSEISKNWAAEPLVSFDTVVNFAANTTTATGLRIYACRDERVYQKGVKVKDKQMKDLALTPGDILPRWNYSIAPQRSPMR